MIDTLDVVFSPLSLFLKSNQSFFILRYFVVLRLLSSYKCAGLNRQPDKSRIRAQRDSLRVPVIAMAAGNYDERSS